MSWTTFTTYYITPGRKGALYTLRKSWSASCPNVGHRSGDDFIANLYTPIPEDAIKRARADHVMNPDTRIEIRGSASGNRDDLSQVITFGKYAGSDIEEVPAAYLSWAMVNCEEKFSQAQRTFVMECRADVRSLLAVAEKERQENIRRRDERIAKQAEWEAARHLAEYVGRVGNRQNFEATVVHTSTFSTQFGDTRFILMKTEEGDILKSIGSAAALWEMEKGETYKFVATVGAHEKYQGQKGTKLLRIKLI